MRYSNIKTKKQILRPLTKCPGGKHYLKNWLIDQFPANYEQMDYGEFFIGGGSVLLNKNRSQRETINDLDGALINIWRTIQDNCHEFQHNLSLLNYSQETFDRALNGDMVWAYNEFVLRRMSRGGLRKTFAWSERLRRGKPGDISGWESALEQLLAIAERLQGVTIENRCAFELLQEIASNIYSFTYLDPPYYHATRTAKKVYSDYEMTDGSHAILAKILNSTSFKGKVLLSGYDCPEYRKWYTNWNHASLDIANHSGQNKTKARRKESVWKNY